MKKLPGERSQLLTIIIVIAVFFSPAAAEELRIGLISERPIGIIKDYHPLAQYLAARLKTFNVTGGKVIVTRNIQEMAQKAGNNEIEILIESAFATVEINEKTGMRPRLLVWKKGVGEYKTLFFVRKESRINTLKDLHGKIVVFESPSSTSAYAVPKAELKRMGLAVFPLDAEARTDAVNYVFVRREINQAFHVLQKKADAGAFSSNDWEELPAKGREELRIIHETMPVLRFIASFRSSMPDNLQNAIIDILTEMHNDPKGLKVLQSAQRTSKIERLTDDNYKSLDYVKNLLKIIRE